ncbi:hypothetical protein PGT21_030632 [Puccinia graminis f. sp. tritici]|uniref:Uncharacterized protein n=1 Tax=Puccinia graminis f. sp. tritici TaxID=56615 RepID=A0A5B0P1G4_PUCGR|nr:hypothetical protein PGTUg99_017687 [Puccinia graminis f. sp. tritici]KAA1094806.1 hypothetical protein PGT21_030632 [Puccinia graminis f. sp. tritici]
MSLMLFFMKAENSLPSSYALPLRLAKPLHQSIVRLRCFPIDRPPLIKAVCGPSLCSVLFVIYFNRSRLLLLSAFFLNIYTNYDLPIRFPTRAATKEYRQNDMLLPSSLRRSNNADYDPTTRFNTSDLGSFPYPLS